MPTVQSVLNQLKSKGHEQTRKTYVRHGMPADRIFGVSAADLKVVAKTIRGEHDLACRLYDTGNVDAMYLAGMIADGSRMTRKQLDTWVKASEGIALVSENTVPWVAVENPQARDLALKWMQSKKEHVAPAGWCTYSGILATAEDGDLDRGEIKDLLKQVVSDIDAAPNRVRYTMNGFVIAVGCYVKPLLKQAKAAAKKIGVVSVDVGDTACKVPLATAYIDKVEGMGRVGKKRKTIRC
jgi:3-methyladenine DNA glycosylase AlkD